MPKRTHDNPARAARLPYQPALDGLRALAVFAVLLYHADIPWAPGGFLGVEVFFVLSGYLISALLLAEWREHSRVDLPAFWLRRACRLLPALFALLASVMAFAVLFLPDEVAGLRGDTLATAGYVLNWRLIFEQKSYFEIIGRPPLLQHLWSLAVEEQFYLLWPLLFVVGMRALRRGGMLFAACAGAAAATLLMAHLYQPDGDPSRVYYGTDTRTAGFLAGAALAFVRAGNRRRGLPSPASALSNLGNEGGAAPQPVWRRKGPWDGTGTPVALVLDCFGAVALGALAWQVVAVDEFQPRLYQGGLAAVAILAAVVVAAAGDGRARLLPRLLSWGPLRWAGVRSYGIYLWHWPIFMITRPQLDIPLDGAPLLALRLAATFALAALSYRYVELPIRGGALGRAWHVLRASRGVERWQLSARWAGAVAVSLAATLALGVAAVEARPPQPPADLLDESVEPEIPVASALVPSAAIAIATMGPADSTALATPAPRPTSGIVRSTNSPTLEGEPPASAIATAAPPSDRQTGGDGQTEADGSPVAPVSPVNAAGAAPPITMAPPTAQPIATAPILDVPAPQAAVPPSPQAAALAPAPALATAGHVLAIGDSVMIGAAKQLRSVITDIEVDAKVSRQATAAVKLVHARRDAGQLGEVVIIHIGSNGPFSAEKFDDLMGQLAGVRRIVIVTVKVPRRWEGPNNAMLAERATRYPNAVLVDWHAASYDHPELFRPDGIHLRPAGARLYADLIAAAVSGP